MKTCRRCKKELPKTTDHFYRDRRKQDGLCIYCKSCSSELQKKSVRKKKEERRKEFEERGIPKSRLHGTQYKKGQLYEIDTRENERARRKVRGRVIQETNNFIVIENKSGIRECFLKRDFYLGDTIKEL